MFGVREPFVSKTSSAEIVHGKITADAMFVIVSDMPKNRVIFRDGVKEACVKFDSSASATISLAERTFPPRRVLIDRLRSMGIRQCRDPVLKVIAETRF